MEGYAYLDVLDEELGGSILSEREWEANFSAVLALAEMAVADGWETNWVRSRCWDEALELLDESDSSRINVWANTTSGGDLHWSCKSGWEEGDGRDEDCGTHSD